MIGIRALAQHLDISIGTVSRALNGKADVNAETRRRVLEAAAELGYSPNQSGRSLRHGTTNLVGVLIPANRKKSLIDFTFAEALNGVREALQGKGLDLAIFLCAEEEDSFAALRRVAERRLADGLIIADTLRSDPRIDYLLERAIPFVAFGRSRSGGGHPWVDIDFPGAVKQAIALLAEAGHQRIGMVLSASEFNFIRLMRETFRRELKSRGLDTDAELLVCSGHGANSGYDGASQLLALAEPPTAMLTQNGDLAVGLYRRLGEAALRPGHDIAVLSMEDDGRAHFLSPSLCSFRADLSEVGARLGAALLSALAAKEAVEPVEALMPMVYRPGESSGWSGPAQGKASPRTRKP